MGKTNTRNEIMNYLLSKLLNINIQQMNNCSYLYGCDTTFALKESMCFKTSDTRNEVLWMGKLNHIMNFIMYLIQ
jgi:hypothetical protein